MAPALAMAPAGTWDTAGLASCVHCGVCLPKCPTYLVLGQEADSPRGRLWLMREAAEGRQPLTPGMAHHIDACLGCLGCETACPSGVPYGRLLGQTRAALKDVGVHAPATWARRGVESLLLRTFPDPRRAQRAVRWLRLYQRSGLQRVVRASHALAPWTRLDALERLLPRLPRATARLPARLPARGAARGRASLLLGCVQRHLQPEINEAAAALLSAAGYEVLIPPDQGCCGALDEHAGRHDAARERARATMHDLGDADIVVATAAGCGLAMKRYTQGGDETAQAFAPRVRDLLEVLADADLPLGPLDETVAIHEPCHLAHGQRLAGVTRRALARIPGLRLVDLPENDLCCGSAGVFNVLEPAIAKPLGARKAQAARRAAAPIIASANPGCALHMAAACRREGVPVRIVHPVELMARALMARPVP